MFSNLEILMFAKSDASQDQLKFFPATFSSEPVKSEQLFNELKTFSLYTTRNKPLGSITVNTPKNQ